MPYSISYHSDFRYIEIISIGEHTFTDYSDQLIKATAMGREKGTFLYLLDNEKLKNLASITEIYNLPKLYKLHADISRLIIAAYYSTEAKNKEAISFYENICVNHGLHVKTFYDKNEALKWLLKESEKI